MKTNNLNPASSNFSVTRPTARRNGKSIRAMWPRLLLAAALAVCAAALAPQPAAAGTYYWDANSTTSGFGTAGGTWGTSAFWSTSSAGTATPANTTIGTGDAVYFGTDTTGLAGGTVTGPSTAQGFGTMTFGAASGGITLSGGTLNINNSTINLNYTGNTYISPTLQGTGPLTIATTSGSTQPNLYFNSVNTYTGGTIVGANVFLRGNLAFPNNQDVTVNSGGVIAFTTSGTYNIGTGKFYINGTGGAAGAGAMYDGNNGNSPTIQAAGVVMQSNSGMGPKNSGGTMTVNAPISGAYSFTKNQNGRVNLAQACTYTGGTIISAGTLQLGVANAVPGNTYAGDVSVSGTLDLNTYSESLNGLNGAGTVDTVAGGTPTLTVGANGNSGTFSGVIKNTAGTLALTKSGAGTQTLSGANTYTGATTVSAGTLKLLRGTTSSSSGITVNDTLLFDNNAGNMTFTTPAISLSGTLTNYGSGNNYTVLGTGAVTVNGTSTIGVNNGGVTSAGFYLDGGLKGSAAVTIQSGANGVGVVLRNSSSTYSGSMTVNGTASATAGTGSGLAVGYSSSSLCSLPNAAITVNGTMELGNNTSGMGWAAGNSSGQTFQMDALGGSGVVVANMATASSTRTLSIGNNGGGGTFSGVIANGANNTLSLTKNGAGTQTLSGANTYTGATTVNQGTLTIGSGGSVNSASLLSIASGAVVNLSQSAWNAFGASQQSGTWTIAGTLRATTAQANTVIANVTLNNGTMDSTGGAPTDYGAFYLAGKNITANGASNTISGNGGVGINGTVTLDTPLATDALSISAAVGVTSALSGGLTKTGAGSVTLSAANTYTGGTTVSAGTLSNAVANALPSGTTVNLNGGTLGMGANATVTALQFDGAPKAAGTWGSPSSAATFKSSRFTGTGILTVSSGPTSSSAVTSSLNPSIYGDSVTFTNTVTGTGANTAAPTGTITFKDGATTIGTASLVSNDVRVAKATLTLTTLTKATHSITAEFAGDENYAASTSGALSQVVNAKGVTITGVTAADKDYDGTTVASLSGGTVSGAVSPDVVTFTAGTGAFASRNVGSQAVTASGYAIGTSGISTNYSLSAQPTLANATISQTNLTVSAVTDSKTYDGNASSTGVPTLSAALQAGDTTNSLTQAFADKNVGAGNKTLIPAITINDGNGGANYNVTLVNDNTGEITARTLNVSAAGVNRAYNGDTNATVNLSGDKLNGDAVSLSYTSAYFTDSKDIGTNKPVEVDGISISGGADAGNYSLGNTSTNTTANVSSANLTVSSGLTAENKVYDGTTNATVIITNTPTLAGVVGSEDVALDTNSYTASLADANAATNKTVTVAGLALAGVDSGNYSLTQPSFTADITPKDASVTADAQIKAYGAANPPLTAMVLGQVAGGDTIAYTLATDATQFSGVGVSNITVSLGSNPNYTVLTTNSTLTINPAPASVTAEAKTKAYGAANPLLTATVLGQVVGGDTIVYTLATDAAQFSAVGVSNITVSLGSNPNYTVLATNSTLTITQAATFVGASSTMNPSGYKDAISFTATLPADATGNVVFSSTNGPISTNTLSGGTASSLSITNLPRGTNVITMSYPGDDNHLGSATNWEQIVTNHPPAVALMTATRTSGLNLRIKLSDIATNWSDVDGDGLSLTNINLTTTNGVTLLLSNVTTNLDGSYVVTNFAFLGYINSNNVADQINYTITDNYGGVTTGYVNIVVSTNAVFGQTNPGIVSTNGGVQVTFYGVPGFTYIVQRNLVDIGNPAAWLDFSTNTATPSNPVMIITDTNHSQAYYRLKWQP